MKLTKQQSTALISTGQWNVPPESLPIVANSCECEVRTVSAVAAGVALSMRRDDRVKVVSKLAIDLEYCIRVYCGASVEGNDEVIDEAINFCLDRFAQLGVGEVREAFSLAAAGEFGEVDLAAYHGRFTIKTLGQVLRAYCEFREKVAKELRRAEQEAEAERQEAERRAKHYESEAKYDDWCSKRLMAMLLLESVNYETIPVLLYNYLDRTGKISLSKDEKWDLMRRAEELVLERISNEGLLEKNPFRKRELSQMVQQVVDGGKPESFVAKCKLAAQQLAVLDWLNAQKQLVGADAD